MRKSQCRSDALSELRACGSYGPPMPLLVPADARVDWTDSGAEAATSTLDQAARSWSRAAEACLAAAMPAPAPRQTHWRGEPPLSRIATTVKKTRQMDPDLCRGRGEARDWACLRSLAKAACTVVAGTARAARGLAAMRGYIHALGADPTLPDRPADLCELCETRVRQADQEVRAASRSDFGEWVRRALAGGAGALHRWTNEAARSPPPPAWAPSQSGLSWSPLDVAAYWRGQWSDIWRRDLERPDLLASESDLDAALPADDLPALSPEEVGNALRSFRAKAATGLDGWSPAELQRIPMGGAQSLARLFGRCEQERRWPTVWRHIAVAMLGKAVGGTCPIALLPMVIRTWEHARRPIIRAWEATGAGFWDDALRGSSALRAAAVRLLWAEVARAEGDQCAAVFWDLEKFYDGLTHRLLAEAAARVGYPATILRLTIDADTTPRYIRVGGCWAQPILPANGILPGSVFGNSKARVYLWPLAAG